MNHLENLLRELGLNEYEAKTYIVLITHGVCNADEISSLAGIPLPRVYDTVNHLQKMGFALITKTRPQQYMPVKSDEALQNFISWKEKEYKMHIDSLKELAAHTIQHINTMEIKEKPRDDKWRIWTTVGKTGITSTRNKFIRNAKREILVMAGDASFINDESVILRKLLRKRICLKIMIRGTENRETLQNLEKLVQMGAELKTGYSGSMRGNVIDGKTALIYIKTGRNHKDSPGSDSEHKYELMVINNPHFVKTIREHFGLNWKNI